MANVTRFARWVVAAMIGAFLLGVMVSTAQTYKRRSDLLQREETGRCCECFSLFARRANFFSSRHSVPQFAYDWVGRNRVRPLEPLTYAHLSIDSDDDVRVLLPETELSHITVVGDGEICTDNLLSHLIALPRLQELTICNVPITNRGVKLLSQFPRLKSLIVECSEAPSPGLEQLSQLTQLEELRLIDERCPISEEVCRQIAAMPNLRRLVLISSIPPQAGFETITRSETLERVSFGRTANPLTIANARRLAGMKSIKFVDVHNSELSTEVGDFLKQAGLLEKEEELVGLPPT